MPWLLQDEVAEYQCIYLHHEDHGVKRDHDQDCVLKRRRDDKVPQSVLERLSVLGHVARERLCTDSEVDAGSLKHSGRKNTNVLV